MADEQQQRSAPTRPRSGNTPPTPPAWKVTPAPDGRGRSPQGPNTPRPNARWLIIGLVLGVLVLNLWVSSAALSPASRVKIPYSPTFLTQVTDGNVQSIDSTGESVQGTFKHPFGYQSTAATVYFSTQIPSFADNQTLETVLKNAGVIQNATGPAD
jgi:cell division protease FtsH